MTVDWNAIPAAARARLVPVIVRFGPRAMLIVLIAILLLAPCDWLPHFPVTVGQVAAALGLVVGLLTIGLRPAERLVGLLNVAAAVATLILAMYPLDAPWCPCVVDIVAIDQIPISTMASGKPIPVRCDVDIEGTQGRARADHYIYVILEGHPKRHGESPRFWSYAVGDRGRSHGNRVSPDWRGNAINLCPAWSRDFTYAVRAIVSPQQRLWDVLPGLPHHACRSPTLDVHIVEAAGPPETPIELRPPLLRGGDAWIVFSLGKSGNDSYETIDSYSVVATIHYAGFDEPIARIDWGDGRGYRTAETRQGNPWFLTNTYATPGKKEVRFLIEARGGPPMHTVKRIDIVPGPR